MIQETSIDDISETYKPIVEIIGIDKFVQVCEYAKGSDLYFPRMNSIVQNARNRRILKEYDGYNLKELAKRYDLTTKQIKNIVSDFEK